MKKLVISLGIFLLFPILLNAQQFSVDDANVVPSRSFLVEGWTGTHGYWNKLGIPFFRNNTEVSVGVGTYDIDYDRLFIEGKWVFPNLSLFGRNLGSVGAVYGGVYNFSFYIQNFYGYVLYSVEVGDFIFTGNTGFINRYIYDWELKFNWGVRTDYQVTERIFLMGEIHNKLFDRVLLQKGVRYSLFNDRLNLFVSAGSEVGIKRGKYRVRVLTEATEFIVLDGKESIDILDRNRVPYFNLGFSFSPNF